MAIGKPLVNNNQAGGVGVVQLQDASGNYWDLVVVDGQGFGVNKNGTAVGFGGLQLIAAKTAAYSVLAADLGTIFTNRAAGGAVTFTLPATTTIAAGWHCKFFVAADQTVTIASNTADTMTMFNDLTADSIAFSTSSEKIGGGVEVYWDGTGWLTFVSLGIETQTPVVAT